MAASPSPLVNSPLAQVARHAMQLAAGGLPAPAAPDASFALLAAALFTAAHNEQLGYEALEHDHAARPTRLKATALDEVRRHADALGDAHRQLMALVPHERAIRAMLASAATRAP